MPPRRALLFWLVGGQAAVAVTVVAAVVAEVAGQAMAAAAT